MTLIKKKKKSIPVIPQLRKYLSDHGREIETTHYDDLFRYNNSIPLLDPQGNDTLWETVFYPQSDASEIHESLKMVYANLKAHRDMDVIKHLYIDRVDICPFGNSKPFRIRIVNKVNDNFDYFYVKIADASRIYGLELEHLLSPNKINYLVHKNTLIEEHIAGIPGDQFIKTYLRRKETNKVRIAKEFVKFNERCFVQLLGDMHSSNFVVDITPDFEETHYRIRAIDFDQQSYEGKLKVYMPQFFKQNLAFVKLAMETMTPESMDQYQLEERALILTRVDNTRDSLNALIDSMKNDVVAPAESVKKLGAEMASHHKINDFKKCKSMGEIVEMNLKILDRPPGTN